MVVEEVVVESHPQMALQLQVLGQLNLVDSVDFSDKIQLYFIAISAKKFEVVRNGIPAGQPNRWLPHPL